MKKTGLAALAVFTWAAVAAPGQKPPEPAPTAGPLPGHSYHGEAFNEGPRQRAYLMKGMPKVHFPVTTRSREAQKYFDQGIGQLHGFWYFEAERSFRQAAVLDPDCAMAYWGMAYANESNEKRARGFFAKALERRASVSEKEQAWIDSMKPRLDESKKGLDRGKAHVAALEEMLKRYPEDVEVKAFLVWQMWAANLLNKKEDRERADRLVSEIHAVNPDHPSHHYRIHMWDYTDAKRAVPSAAVYGQVSPGIAHAWHMPGHIFSQLKRYADAAWQQEASARADHAHMIRDRVMPDQIHNYAHNNEWLIRDLINIGRARDAQTLAKNLIELPRHPAYNDIAAWRGSSYYGRERLLDTISRCELWNDLIAFEGTPYAETVKDAQLQARLECLLAVSHFEAGEPAKAQAFTEELAARLEREREEQAKLQREAEAKAREAKKTDEEIAKAGKSAAEERDRAIERVEKYLAEARLYRALFLGNTAEAKTLYEKAGELPAERKPGLWLRMGDPEQAEKAARDAVSNGKEQVIPLCNLVDTLAARGKQAEARDHFGRLRKLGAYADPELPAFRRLASFSQAEGCSADWRLAPEIAPDAGDRPPLDKLGPFRWTPPSAPAWTLPGPDGKKRSLSDYRGRPVLVLFYLGAGCTHCMEQLNLFAPKTADFEKLGIALVAVSTEAVGDLKKSLSKSSDGKGFPFPIVADPSHKTFRAYRAYDDFEQQPLHGAFLVDGKGRVRWQDIGYEPFTQTDFLLAESKRLLGFEPSTGVPVAHHLGE